MKFLVVISMGEIDGENRAEATEKAKEMLESYAESSDGSEVLANSVPELFYIGD